MNEEYGKPWPSGLRQSIVKIIQPEMKEFAIRSVHASVLKLLQVSVSGCEKSFLGERCQGHPTDCFGGISVRKTCNRLKFSVREMSSRAFLINAFCFRRDKNDVLDAKIGR